MKNKKMLIIVSITLVIAIFVSLVLYWYLGIFRLQHKKDEYWLRYRSDKLTYVGNTLFWSVDSCETMGIVYAGGLFTVAHGNNNNAIYYWYPLFGGKKTGSASIYVSEEIDCDVRNNIFDSVSLSYKSGNTSRYNLDAPISAYTFCVPYSGSELNPKRLNEIGIISLNHAEIEWLHLDYTVYCDAENYYCYKMNGVYEDGERNKNQTWFVITDESLKDWFSEWR